MDGSASIAGRPSEGRLDKVFPFIQTVGQWLFVVRFNVMGHLHDLSTTNFSSSSKAVFDAGVLRECSSELCRDTKERWMNEGLTPAQGRIVKMLKMRVRGRCACLTLRGEARDCGVRFSRPSFEQVVADTYGSGSRQYVCRHSRVHRL